MLEALTWQQLLGWLAYYEVEPFGEERADYRIGILTAAVHNALRRQGSRPYKPTDFMLSKPLKGDHQQGLEDMKRLARMIVLSHQGRVREKIAEEDG